jgi:hypothetical protein
MNDVLRLPDGRSERVRPSCAGSRGMPSMYDRHVPSPVVFATGSPSRWIGEHGRHEMPCDR